MVLSPILDQYPKEFQNHCKNLVEQYETNFSAFLAVSNEHAVMPLLNDADYPYIFAVMMGLTNTNIAKNFGISQQTVKRRLDRLCENFGVNNQEELKDYLQRYV